MPTFPVWHNALRSHPTRMTVVFTLSPIFQGTKSLYIKDVCISVWWVSQNRIYAPLGKALILLSVSGFSVFSLRFSYFLYRDPIYQSVYPWSIVFRLGIRLISRRKISDSQFLLLFISEFCPCARILYENQLSLFITDFCTICF